MIARVVLIGCLILAAVGLIACNTMNGLGRDIQAAGEALQDAAD